MNSGFDYGKAMAELEEIAQKVEDPSTALEDVDKLIKRSNELVAACHAYLRTIRDKVYENQEDLRD